MTEGAGARVGDPVRNWRRRLTVLAAQAAGALLIVWLVDFGMTLDTLRGQLPALAGNLLDGRPAETPLAVDGKPGLIYFWATWCPVCRAQRGPFSAAAADYPHLAVAMNSGSSGEVRDYLAEEGLRWNVLNDEQGQRAAAFGVQAVPMTFFLNPQREIVLVTRGYTSEWGLRLRLWLARWL